MTDRASNSVATQLVTPPVLTGAAGLFTPQPMAAQKWSWRALGLSFALLFALTGLKLLWAKQLGDAPPFLWYFAPTALTGYGQTSDKERALAAGFDEHLVKPISIEAVQAVVSRLLTVREAESRGS